MRSSRIRTGRVARAAAASLVVLSTGLAVQWDTADPAGAADGRGVDAVSEVVAYYQHFLGRTPDIDGLLHFLDGANADCRSGLRSAGWAIANSGEAAAFLTSNDRRANSLYAGFLNRIPDPQGWNDQKNALDAGVSFAQITRNVQNSPEYSGRLDAVCAGARPHETLQCDSIAAQGPPSASIPPERQPYFNCNSAQAASISGVPIRCMVAVVKATVGITNRHLDWRGTGKLVMKKAGVVGWALTGHDVLKVFRRC